MILTEQNILTVAPGSIVMLENPATGEFEECILSEMKMPTTGLVEVYLTTTASDTSYCVFESYTNHVQHLRRNNWHAVMTREAMAELLVSKDYTIS